MARRTPTQKNAHCARADNAYNALGPNLLHVSLGSEPLLSQAATSKSRCVAMALHQASEVVSRTPSVKVSFPSVMQRNSSASGRLVLRTWPAHGRVAPGCGVGSDWGSHCGGAPRLARFTQRHPISFGSLPLAMCRGQARMHACIHSPNLRSDCTATCCYTSDSAMHAAQIDSAPAALTARQLKCHAQARGVRGAYVVWPWPPTTQPMNAAANSRHRRIACVAIAPTNTSCGMPAPQGQQGHRCACCWQIKKRACFITIDIVRSQWMTACMSGRRATREPRGCSN